MLEFIHRIRARLGDYWWYSLVLFLAQRFADVMNAFVGLWLVPKYIDSAELGAVMPLVSLAGFFALPVSIFSMTFRSEISRLSSEGQYGRLRTLMKSVFIASGVFFVLALAFSRLVLPLFLERIRIAAGSLGILILASSFAGSIAGIYSFPLQALKKFKATSIIGIVGAPVRLVTMLVAMPFRPLSGYFTGQTSCPVFNIFASIFCLRKELAVKPEPYWTREHVRRFSRLFCAFAAASVFAAMASLVESTVLRQRLSDLDSAGYYMATRFSDIASFLTVTLAFTLFPFAADLSHKGARTAGLILKSTLATFAFCVLVALPFFFFGEDILALLPHGEEYSSYWWAIPWLIALAWLNSIWIFYTTAEISAFRFSYLKWMVPIDILYPALMLGVTGYGYFVRYLPEGMVRFLSLHNIRSLDTMLWWMTATVALKAVFSLVAMFRQRNPSKPSPLRGEV